MGLSYIKSDIMDYWSRFVRIQDSFKATWIYRGKLLGRGFIGKLC